MKINIGKIPASGLSVDENIILDKKFYSHANLLDLNSLHVLGNIMYDYENNLVFDLEVRGVFLLEDAITLEPIEYPFSCKIEEKIENIEETCGDFFEKSKNILDISEILWENIVLEIPISVTKANSSELSLSGDGWELKNENKEKIDPRLAKLTELLEKGKD